MNPDPKHCRKGNIVLNHEKTTEVTKSTFLTGSAFLRLFTAESSESEGDSWLEESPRPLFGFFFFFFFFSASESLKKKRI
jgi:hypothetical protein